MRIKFPDQSLEDLLESAEEKALEAWDCEQHADNFQGE
jgi:hypothetical protein